MIPVEKFFYSGNEREITAHAAARIISEAYSAVNDHGRFSLVLAGGNSPRHLYAQLAHGVSTALLERYALAVPQRSYRKNQNLLPLPKNTWLFLGDERCVPIGHPDSNYKMVTETLLPNSGIDSHHLLRMPAEEADTELAAKKYEAVIRSFFSTSGMPVPQAFPVFDLIVLGLGEDGHTASLFADTLEALRERKRWVLAVNAPKAKPPGKRLTLTLHVLNHARNILFFTLGRGKSELAEKIFLEQEKSVPASLVKPEEGRVFWFTSRSSAPIQGL